METELLVPRPDHEEILREGLGVMDRLDETVSGLLTLGRGVRVDRGPIDAQQVVGELVSRWQQPFRQVRRDLRIGRVESADETPTGSAMAVGHVLDVLIDNALRHGRGNVTVTGEADHGCYSVRVADEGSVSDSSLLFRARSSRPPGTGIGLALARTLAAAEGARLHLVTASPTTFELVLSVAGSAA